MHFRSKLFQYQSPLVYFHNVYFENLLEEKRNLHLSSYNCSIKVFYNHFDYETKPKKFLNFNIHSTIRLKVSAFGSKTMAVILILEK